MIGDFDVRILENHSIGWLLIRTDTHSSELLSKEGKICFHRGRVVRDDGIELYATRQKRKELIKSIASYSLNPNTGDIVLFGNVLEGYLVSFEEHNGTHGGFVFDQVSPFIITRNKELLEQLEKNNSMKHVFKKLHDIRYRAE
jgi:hypothetical protein